jgi:hypothetical protein
MARKAPVCYPQGGRSGVEGTPGVHELGQPGEDATEKRSSTQNQRQVLRGGRCGSSQGIRRRLGRAGVVRELLVKVVLPLVVGC